MATSLLIAPPKRHTGRRLANDSSTLYIQALSCSIRGCDPALRKSAPIHPSTGKTKRPEYSISYLSNNKPRLHLNLPQNTNQRLSNHRPNLQRRQLIATSHKRSTRHNKRIHPIPQMRFRLLHNAQHSLRRALRRRNKLLDLHFNDRQLTRCAAPIR